MQLDFCSFVFVLAASVSIVAIACGVWTINDTLQNLVNKK